MGFLKSFGNIVASTPQPFQPLALGAKALAGDFRKSGGGGGGGGGGGATSAGFAFTPEKFNSIVTTSQFQNTLGRNPTQQELDFIKRLITEGNITNFEANEIIQDLPEAARSRAFEDTRQLGIQAGQFDQQILGDAEEQIQSTFAKQGRRGSSGRLAAFAEAAAGLAQDRNNRLLNFLAPRLQGISQNITRRSEGARGRTFKVADQQQAFRQSEIDRIRDANDYQNLLRQQDTRNLQGALTNAGVGLGTKLLTGGLGAGAGALSGSGPNSFSAGQGFLAGSLGLNPFGARSKG